MKRWLSILIVVCVLLTASSVKADDDYYPNNKYKSFLDIENFYKDTTTVLVIDSDAGKVGVNSHLTNYLRLKVKNNFTDIKFIGLGKSTGKQTGYISVRVLVLGNSASTFYHIITKFNSYYRPFDDTYTIKTEESFGHCPKDSIPDRIKTNIGSMVEDLAILFYKVRGEL
jgi:hypothetical protein